MMMIDDDCELWLVVDTEEPAPRREGVYLNLKAGKINFHFAGNYFCFRTKRTMDDFTKRDTAVIPWLPLYSRPSVAKPKRPCKIISLLGGMIYLYNKYVLKLLMYVILTTLRSSSFSARKNWVEIKLH